MFFFLLSGFRSPKVGSMAKEIGWLKINKEEKLKNGEKVQVKHEKKTNFMFLSCLSHVAA